MLAGEIVLKNNHYYYYFITESTEAMRIKCLAQGHNILMPEFEPSTPVSRNRHSNHDQYAPNKLNLQLNNLN